MVFVPFIFPEGNLTLKGRTSRACHKFVRRVIALGLENLDWRDEFARGNALTRSVIFLIDDVVKEGPAETIRSLDKAVKTTLWESAPDPQDTVPILPG